VFADECNDRSGAKAAVGGEPVPRSFQGGKDPVDRDLNVGDTACPARR
jgi:hypothetical protein